MKSISDAKSMFLVFQIGQLNVSSLHFLNVADFEAFKWQT